MHEKGSIRVADCYRLSDSIRLIGVLDSFIMRSSDFLRVPIRLKYPEENFEIIDSLKHKLYKFTVVDSARSSNIFFVSKKFCPAQLLGPVLSSDNFINSLLV